MGQITIYLNNDLENRVKKTAHEMDVSISKYIATLLENRMRGSWSAEVQVLAGQWRDFPTLEELRSGGQDTPRESL
ncbi:MAG: hypothetical protein AB7E49_09705 [Campylobacterales bacterium]